MGCVGINSSSYDICVAKQVKLDKTNINTVTVSGDILADFEGLIKQALAKQDSSDPDVRARIYQSSRAALARMIAKKPDVASATVQRQEMMLEQSIQKIEALFNIAPQPASAPSVAPPPPVPTVSHEVPSPQVSHEPVVSNFQTEASYEGAPEPVLNPVYGEAEGEIDRREEQDIAADLAHGFRSRRRVIKFVGFVGLVAIIAMVVYVSYILILGLVGNNAGNLSQNREVNRVSALNPVDKNSANPGQYITLLEPNDPSSLITNGAGQADIVNDVDATVLRIVSVRSKTNKSQPAKPILLEIQPGIIAQIRGKKITVEILVKSGSSGPATFSVECLFGELGSCGRKRFRVGLQPEAVVFSIDMKNGEDNGEKAYLALRTDIASSANLSGRGDTLDILSARLRIVGDN